MGRASQEPALTLHLHTAAWFWAQPHRGTPVTTSPPSCCRGAVGAPSPHPQGFHSNRCQPCGEADGGKRGFIPILGCCGMGEGVGGCCSSASARPGHEVGFVPHVEGFGATHASRALLGAELVPALVVLSCSSFPCGLLHFSFFGAFPTSEVRN